jgi:hypothetical protein
MAFELRVRTFLWCQHFLTQNSSAMKNTMIIQSLFALLFCWMANTAVIHAQAPAGAGTEAGKAISEIFEKAKPDKSQKDDVSVKKRAALRELERAVKKAAKDNPNNADAVKDVVKGKLEELAGEKKNKVLEDFLKGLKDKILKSKKGKEFTFRNDTGRNTNDLHLVLSGETRPINIAEDPKTGVKKVGGVYENYPDKKSKKHDYKTGGVVTPGNTVKIQMEEETEVISWYWTFDGEKIGDGEYGYEGIAVISVVPLPDPFQPGRALVSVGVGVSRPFNNPKDIYISHAQLHDNFTRSITSQPEVIEQIMERLGGVFVPGVNTNPSQHILPDATLRASAQVIPGLQLGFSPIRNIEFTLGAHYFHSTFTDRLPITVFPFENSTPRIEYGTINASSLGLLLDVGVKYMLRGKVQPYVEAGGRRLSVLQHETRMEVAGLELPFDEIKISSGFSAYAGAGVRAYLGSNAYLQAGAMLTKWLGSEYSMGGNVNIGWTFGRK